MIPLERTGIRCHATVIELDFIRNCPSSVNFQTVGTLSSGVVMVAIEVRISRGTLVAVAAGSHEKEDNKILPSAPS